MLTSSPYLKTAHLPRNVYHCPLVRPSFCHEVHLVIVYFIHLQRFCEHVLMSIPAEILHPNTECPDQAGVTSCGYTHTRTENRIQPSTWHRCHKYSVQGTSCSQVPPAPAIMTSYASPLFSWSGTACLEEHCWSNSASLFPFVI